MRKRIHWFALAVGLGVLGSGYAYALLSDDNVAQISVIEQNGTRITAQPTTKVHATNIGILNATAPSADVKLGVATVTGQPIIPAKTLVTGQIVTGEAIVPSEQMKLIQKYQNAKESQQKEDVRKALSDLVSKELEIKFGEAEKEVESLKSRLNDAQIRLSERRENSGEIVERRVKRLLREKDSLDWDQSPLSQGAGKTIVGSGGIVTARPSMSALPNPTVVSGLSTTITVPGELVSPASEDSIGSAVETLDVTALTPLQSSSVGLASLSPDTIEMRVAPLTSPALDTIAAGVATLSTASETATVVPSMIVGSQTGTFLTRESGPSDVLAAVTATSSKGGETSLAGSVNVESNLPLEFAILQLRSMMTELSDDLTDEARNGLVQSVKKEFKLISLRLPAEKKHFKKLLKQMALKIEGAKLNESVMRDEFDNSKQLLDIGRVSTSSFNTTRLKYQEASQELKLLQIELESTQEQLDEADMLYKELQVEFEQWLESVRQK